MQYPYDISVIVPLFNEEESLPELVRWIKRVMHAHEFSYEIILVDDGSTDRSWEVIQDLSADDNTVKGISFNRNYGKSAALHMGFQRCAGEFAHHQIAPGLHFEAAIARLQRRQSYTALLQRQHPRAVGAQPGPACAAERQHRQDDQQQRGQPRAARTVMGQDAIEVHRFVTG